MRKILYAVKASALPSPFTFLGILAVGTEHESIHYNYTSGHSSVKRLNEHE